MAIALVEISLDLSLQKGMKQNHPSHEIQTTKWAQYKTRSIHAAALWWQAHPILILQQNNNTNAVTQANNGKGSKLM